MLNRVEAKRWGIGGLVLIVVLVLFNSSQRPIQSKLERKYDIALDAITPALTSNESIDSLTPPVSISLEVTGGETFYISSTNKNVTREQLFRLLQLINNSGLLAYADQDDYVLKVSIGDENFLGSFSKETLLATSVRRNLAKLLSIYSKTPKVLNGENNENQTGS